MIWALPDSDTYFAPQLARDPRGFEIDHLQIALKYCTMRRVSVDGGAHIGTWSRALSDQFLVVMAFEPAPDTYACLIENTRDRENVMQLQQALGERSGMGQIIDDITRSGNTGSRYIVPGNSIQVVPLDQYKLRTLDFLKLDVEGYELAALCGAAETIKRCRPVVMIEVKRLRPGHDPMAAVKYLETMGYCEVERARNDWVFVKNS